VGLRAGLDAAEKNSLAPAGNQILAVQPVAMPTELYVSNTEI
jgi:hypothetical protein